ncbi:hypothetical protein [Aliiglaciecola lipolytica]|uniref:Uncharacterized protein n=1 Tax=Aliiglaciecola lipolytica E3 TaxID=1127673 RepID=K6YNR7_9ALTE|nr:hypothetical protein [Aliiglaciecola lipolytica]GAC12990.1 hypothetical protein GLIP_0340 [Aliiglaciecola lipolytica E3]
MNHLLLTLPFIVLGTVLILVLAMSDPRRRQLANKTHAENKLNVALSSNSRKLIGWSLVLPLIPLILMANYAGILMYAGALTTIGWLVSELPSSLL